MQTTNSNDSMMSDFFQVGGHSNFGGQLRQMQERLIAQVKEKRRKEALEIKRLIEEEEKIEKDILNEQNVLKNQVVL